MASTFSFVSSNLIVRSDARFAPEAEVPLAFPIRIPQATAELYVDRPLRRTSARPVDLGTTGPRLTGRPDIIAYDKAEPGAFGNNMQQLLGLKISAGYFGRIVAAGVVCGLLTLVFALGNSTLIARNELQPFLPAVVGVLLVAAALMPAVTAYFSTIPGQITATQEISVIALIPVVTATTGAYSGDPSQLAFLATVLVAIGLATAISGVGMVALGQFGLGRVIRFVPYPVFGGFLAITGWYLFTGGLETVIGHHLDLEQLVLIATNGTIAFKVGCALVFVALVQLFNERLASGALLPYALVAAAILFNLVVLILGIPVEGLQDSGWIIRVPAGGVVWPPVGLADLAAIDWRAVGHGLLFAPLVALVTAAAAMMNVSGIEIETRGELNLNRELKSMGTGTLLSGLVGGVPGFPAVSGTLIAYRMGAPHRLVGILTGVVVAIAVVFANGLLRAVPAPLLGALLMWVGTALLIDWVIKPLRTLRRREHGIILMILAVSIVAGFPAGILAGLGAALMLFVFEYSRVEGIRFAATGRDYQSRMLPGDQRSVLERIGGSIVIMKLSGFIFFGTSDRIIQRVADRVVATAPEPVKFLVMDFRRVSGIDSSTVMSFDRLRRLAEQHDVSIILAGLNDEIRGRLTLGGIDPETAPFHTEADLDSAVGFAERELLAAEVREPNAGGGLARQLGSEALAEAMKPYCDIETFAAGTRLIEQGSSADDIFFIASGEGIVALDDDPDASVTLMRFGAGTVLGEVAFYLGELRSASAIASTDVTAWKLSRTRLADIERERPALSAAFHYEIARALAERLQSANRLIRVLSD